MMLHIAPGMANTYVYDIPKNMPQGAYWYHSHPAHGDDCPDLRWLGGTPGNGRTGNTPLVTANRIPIRT